MELALAASARAAAAGRDFRFAVCNETFQGIAFDQRCRLARRIGYTGVEIMPGTLSEDPVSIPPARRAQLRRIVEDHGLSFVGLHNLLMVPPGLRASTADPQLRRRTWDFIRGLVDLCADLGPNRIMVLGSGKQRDAEPGAPISDALARFRDGLGSIAPHARQAGVTILIEPLAPPLSNLINRLDEAVEFDQPPRRSRRNCTPD